MSCWKLDIWRGLFSTLIGFGTHRKECNFNFDDLVTTCRYRSNCLGTAEHSGTHLDARAHFVRDGMTTDQIHMDKLTGPGCIINVTVSMYSIQDILVLRVYCFCRRPTIIVQTASYSFGRPPDFKWNQYILCKCNQWRLSGVGCFYSRYMSCRGCLRTHHQTQTPDLIHL